MADIKTELAAFIKRESRDRGWLKPDGTANQSEIIRQAKHKGLEIDQTTISNILNLAEKSITTKTLENVMAIFEATPADLFARNHHNFAPTLPYMRRVPVIDFITAGAWGDINDSYEPGDGMEEAVIYRESLSDEAFALSVEGSSMEPEFREGDIIVIDPNTQPTPGDYVIAKLFSEEMATFKKYRPRGRDSENTEIIELVPLNEDWPTITINKQNPGFIIGKVVCHIRNF